MHNYPDAFNSITRRRAIALAASTALSLAAFAGSALAADPVKLALLSEISGGSADLGWHFKNGVELAVSEINAAGGLLGRKIEVTVYDTQTNPGVARAVMQRALDETPYVVIGPVISSECKSTMPLANQHEIPQIGAGEASELTAFVKAQGIKYFFRSSLATQYSLPTVAEYIRDEMKAKSVVILWENDEAGKSARDVMIDEAKSHGLKVLADLPSENNQSDFAADVIRAKSYNPDVYFIHLREPDTARLIREMRRQGVKTPMIGDTNIVSQVTLDLGKEAMEGVLGWVGLTPQAPHKTVQDFVKKYEKFGRTPDHNAIKGYLAVYAVKYATEKNKKIDSKALAATLRGATITTKEEPGILLDTKWDENGDVVDRDSFFVRVEGGKQVILKTVPRKTQ